MTAKEWGLRSANDYNRKVFGLQYLVTYDDFHKILTTDCLIFAYNSQFAFHAEPAEIRQVEMKYVQLNVAHCIQDIEQQLNREKAASAITLKKIEKSRNGF